MIGIYTLSVAADCSTDALGGGINAALVFPSYLYRFELLLSPGAS